jgi:dipeptidyl aminopeptidase/acylaminoacyl peptidase
MRYNTAKSIDYVPVEAAKQIKVPTLIVDAEKEELLNVNRNGKLVADILKKQGTAVSYHILKGASHYSIYKEYFTETLKLQIDWFDKHLKGRQ